MRRVGRDDGLEKGTEGKMIRKTAYEGEEGTKARKERERTEDA